MHEQLAILGIFVAFAASFVIANVAILSRLLRPKVPGTPAKTAAYECGEPAIGAAWVRFDIRFYTTALVFLIFEVEVAFLYPWAVVFRDLRGEHGWYAFSEVLIFLVILAVGFVYVWVKGDLDWVKSTRGQRLETPGGGRALEPAAAPATPVAIGGTGAPDRTAG